MPKPLFLLITASFIICSCKKDSFISSSNAQIGFSTDSVYFDTLFTSTGSTTQSVKIYNQNNQKILLSDIQLAGGTASAFVINIDGAPGPSASQVTIAANDSLYIFISVLIKPSAAPIPFLLTDSISISYNGNLRYIKLSAWGQNAHFLTNEKIDGNVTWPNDLPYVIAGSLTVDSNATLNISPGTHLYFHADAPMLIDGTLKVNGNAGDSLSVYFASDRLDDPYSHYPGGWPGIYFHTSSSNNLLTYANIYNAYQAIVLEDPSPNASPKIVLQQCKIDNALNAGIIALHSSIQATNCLISNCGQNVSLEYGGSYAFTHCTMAAYSNNYIQHLQPVLTVTNYLLNGAQVLSENLQASFINCIVWGSAGTLDNELIISSLGSGTFSLQMTNCLLREKNFPSMDSSGLILNQDPLFVETDNIRVIYDFHVQSGSPAINNGVNAGVGIDLDGNPRPVGQPDIGCYEKQ